MPASLISHWLRGHWFAPLKMRGTDCIGHFDLWHLVKSIWSPRLRLVPEWRSFGFGCAGETYETMLITMCVFEHVCAYTQIRTWAEQGFFFLPYWGIKNKTTKTVSSTKLDKKKKATQWHCAPCPLNRLWQMVCNRGSTLLQAKVPALGRSNTGMSQSHITGSTSCYDGTTLDNIAVN